MTGNSLLIACRQAEAPWLRSELEREAHSGWATDPRLVLFPWDAPRDEQGLARVLRDLCDRDGGVMLLATETLRGDVYRELADSGHVSAHPYRFSSRDKLRDLLRRLVARLDLDTVGEASRRLASFNFPKVTREDVESWLGQFERADAKWVGLCLLQSLAILGPDQLIAAWRLDSISRDDYDCICVNATGRNVGSSPGNVKRYAELHLAGTPGAPPVRSLEDALQDRYVKRICLIEDCLISGRQFKEMARAIGPRLEGRQVECRHAVVANGGKLEVEALLEMNEWGQAFTIVKPPGGHLLTLTGEGERRFKAGTLYAGSLVDNPHETCALPAFADTDLWGGPEKRNRAISLCQEIGAQIVEKQYRGELDWSDMTIIGDMRRLESLRQLGLGWQGLGLALAFTHSVPNATLPVISWHEPVKVKLGRQNPFTWKPLLTRKKTT